jgi:hypothetical protein
MPNADSCQLYSAACQKSVEQTILRPVAKSAVYAAKRLISEERKAAKQAAYERRRKAREIYFGKGAGKMKNLRGAEKKFVMQVRREAYTAYVQDYMMKTSRWNVRRGPKFRKYPGNSSGRPQHFLRWQFFWRSGNKARYMFADVPKMAKKNFEEALGKQRSVLPATQGELHAE